PERDRRARLAAAMGQYEGVLAIDLEDLKRNVAPALAVEGGIVRRIRRLPDDQHRVARKEGHRAIGWFALRQSKRLAVEAAMRRDVANAKTDADTFDPEQALRHQRNAIAVRVDHRLRRRDAIARDQQLAIAGRRIIG